MEESVNSSEASRQPQQNDRFKWACLGSAIIFACILMWMIADFKNKMVIALRNAENTVSQVRFSVDKVNHRMPSMLSEIHTTSRTLKGLADDVELIKEVAGVGEEAKDRGIRSLAVYVREVQDLLQQKSEDSNATVLIEEVVGSDLKEVDTLKAFLVGVNKEMLVILTLSNSNEETLYRICHSGIRRKPYYIQLENEDPIKLEDYIRQHHPESRELPVFKGKD